VSIKLKLSAAAFVTFVAMGASAGSASAASSLICDQAVSRQACSTHIDYVKELQKKTVRVTHGRSTNYLDPTENAALRDAGGGGGGGGGGGR
jgi:hypothetical protein